MPMVSARSSHSSRSARSTRSTRSTRGFYANGGYAVKRDHEQMHAALAPAAERFKTLQAENQEEAEQVRSHMSAFRNLYGYLSQIIPFQDSDLEKSYGFLRHLLPLLPRKFSSIPDSSFDDEVRLKYYRLQKIAEGKIDLEYGEANPLKGPADVGTGIVKEEYEPLSSIINVLNEHFGTEFSNADQLFFDSVKETAKNDSEVKKAVKANSLDRFLLMFDKLLEGYLLDRDEANEEIVARFLNEADFKSTVARGLGLDVYKELRADVIGEMTCIGEGVRYEI